MIIHYNIEVLKLYGVIKFMKYGKADSLGPFVGIGKVVCAVAQRNIAFGVRTSGSVYGNFLFVVVVLCSVIEIVVQKNLRSCWIV